MIWNDENIQILLSKEAVYITRKTTTLSYKLSDFTKGVSAFDSKLYRSIDGNIYGYTGGMITMHGCSEETECGVGPVADFIKADGAFYFVKSKVNRMILVNHENRQIHEFSRIFCFAGPYLYYAEIAEGSGEEEDQHPLYDIVRLDIISLNTQRIGTIRGKIVRMAAYRTDDMVDLVALADGQNNLHIINNGKIIVYKWCSNKIVDMVLTEDYAIVACKDGCVAKFSVLNDERVFLFEYLGDFIDMRASDGRIFFLSSVCLIVYDLGMEKIVYEDILPMPSSYSVVDVGKEENAAATDIFQLKKRSKVEIWNSLKRYGTTEVPEGRNLHESIGFVNGNVMFLLDPRGIRAQFVLDSEFNFISSNKLISVEYKKSKMILQIYSISAEKLVLLFKRELTRTTLDYVYFSRSNLYIRNNSGIYLVNDMGIPEQVHDGDILGMSSSNGLKVLDSRGLFDIDAGKYIFKQKQVSKFCICEQSALFYIKGRGLYLCDSENSMERVLLDAFDGLVDLAEAEQKGCFYVLSNTNNQKVLCLYELVDGSAVLVEQRSVEGSCTAILAGWAFTTQTRQLLTVD